MQHNSASITEGVRMLGIFGSVGVTGFDLTLTDRQGEKVQFRRSMSLDNLCRFLPDLFDRSGRQQENIIVRPYGPAVFLIQLDDLALATCERIAPASFLQLQTSPGNYQAWIALAGSRREEEFARRLRQGSGADPSASGATRIAGSYNFKPKYAPDFPRIEIARSAPGQLADKDQLAALGLVAQPTPPRVSSPAFRPQGTARRWPSYAKCLAGAPPNREQSGPDVSRADYTFCLIAIDWGWSIEATAARLMEESAKAQENGERYAILTAQQAAAGIERRSSPSTPPRRSDPNSEPGL